MDTTHPDYEEGFCTNPTDNILPTPVGNPNQRIRSILSSQREGIGSNDSELNEVHPWLRGNELIDVNDCIRAMKSSNKTKIILLSATPMASSPSMDSIMDIILPDNTSEG